MIHITLDVDAGIEPGHQWLVVDDGEEGRALARLLMGFGAVPFKDDCQRLCIPHDETVDRNIVQLINELAHVRYQAPEIVQLTLQESAG